VGIVKVVVEGLRSTCLPHHNSVSLGTDVLHPKPCRKSMGTKRRCSSNWSRAERARRTA